MTSHIRSRRAGARLAAAGVIGVLGLAAVALPAHADDDITYNMWLSADEGYYFTATPGEDSGPQAGTFRFEAWEWGGGFGNGADVTLEFAPTDPNVALALHDDRCSTVEESIVCEFDDYQLGEDIEMDAEVGFGPDFELDGFHWHQVEVTFAQGDLERTYSSSVTIPVKSGDEPRFSLSAELDNGVLYPKNPWVTGPQHGTLSITADYLPESVARPTEVSLTFGGWQADYTISTDDERCDVDADFDDVLVCEFSGVVEGDTIEVPFSVDDVSGWNGEYPWTIQLLVPDEHLDWDLYHDGSWAMATDYEWEQYPAEDVALDGLEPGSSATFSGPRFNATGEQGIPGLIIEMGGFPDASLQMMADYDNCLYSDDRSWVTCVVPGFDPVAGQTYQISSETPVGVYAPETVPGPYTHTGRTWISYDPNPYLAEEHPELFKDSYENPLLVEPASKAWVPDSDGLEDSGGIAVGTTENRYDLTTASVEITGAVGDLVTVDFPVINDSGADAYGASVLLTLPSGVAVAPDAYLDYTESACMRPQDWWPEDMVGDLYCSVWELDAGATVTVPIQVEIVGDAPSNDGLVTVADIGFEPGMEGLLESDTENNSAAVSFKTGTAGDGKPELPVTGTSMTVFVGAAAGVVAVGVAAFVFVRRRRTAENW